MAHGSQHLPVWQYDALAHKWTSVNPSALSYRRPQHQQSLRVITYNIWFDRTNQPLRFQHLSAILKRSKAQIICLQEVTRDILRQLTSQPWVQHRYLLSDIDGRTFVNGPQSYGVLMLIEKSLDLQRLQTFPFPTRQGRQFLLTQIQVRKEIFLVGTIHLESTRGGEDSRSRQLQICQTIFNRLARNRSNVTYLLMGDFNFGARGLENTQQMNILQGWSDLWPTLNGPDDPGNTRENARIDRIMFDSSHVNPIQIRIIGNRPIGPYSKKQRFPLNIFEQMTDLFPSDHFGLMADFDLTGV